MNVKQLRELIEDLDDETEVRLMIQQSWPFEESIAGLWTPELPRVDDEAHCEECHETLRWDGDQWLHRRDADHEPEVDSEMWSDFRPHEAEGQVVYLVEGSQLAYGTKRAWEEVATW